VEQIQVVENLGDHLFGNVYVKFGDEDQAAKCLTSLAGRFYAGKVVTPEYCPVSDFSEARCRQFDEETCNRGPYCNFMHLKHVGHELRKALRKQRRKWREANGKRSRSRSRERGGGHRGDRGRDRSPGRRDDRDRDRDRGRDRDRDRSDRDRGSGSSSSSSSGSGDKAADDRKVRGSSAERRAKIAMWNKEKRGGGDTAGAAAGSTAGAAGAGDQAAAQAAGGDGYSQLMAQQQASAAQHQADVEAQRAAAIAAALNIRK